MTGVNLPEIMENDLHLVGCNLSSIVGGHL